MSDNPIHTVRHRTTLLRLAHDGLIAEPPEHVRPKGKRWGANGYWYVDTVSTREGLGPSWQPWQGWLIRRVYYDGCFFPFVEYKLP